MARKARLDATVVLHHVVARGIERRPIFIDDRDRDEFVRHLSDLASEGKLIVYAWSLMPNHFLNMLQNAMNCNILQQKQSEVLT